MEAPWGLVAAGPTVATIGVGDVDGGPPVGCWWQIRQRSSPELRHRWWAPWGVLAVGPTAATNKVGDVDGGPP
jgi:hypothetical protein